VPPEDGIKLRAEDADDLAVISACLQDALVAVRDLAYDRAARQFVLVANRFRWENRPAGSDGDAEFERVVCGVAFGGVDAVAYRGFRRSDEDGILSLLAIHAPPSDEAGTIELAFAADATIRLTVSEICCNIRDLGEPWPTTWAPDHPLDDNPP
jgi:hypothetical protein